MFKCPPYVIMHCSTTFQVKNWVVPSYSMKGGYHPIIFHEGRVTTIGGKNFGAYLSLLSKQDVFPLCSMYGLTLGIYGWGPIFKKGPLAAL